MTPDQFRTALGELGLTQARFAAMTGEHPQTISKRCCGRKPIPEYTTLIIALLRELKQHEVQPVWKL